MRLSEFLTMGGYAFYVWGSYAVALVTMGGEVLFLWRRKQSLKQEERIFAAGSSDEEAS